MKKIFMALTILTLGVLLIACVQEPAPRAPSTPPPPNPPPPAPVMPDMDDTMDDTMMDDTMMDDDMMAEPVEGEAEIVDDGSDILAAEDTADMGSKLEGVACDPDENKITFTVTNVGLLDWDLDQNAPFVSNEVKNVKIFINGYEANRGSTQYHPDTREPMFGPNELFSENCGGQNILSPGDSVECTLYPVKLNRGTGSDSLNAVNLIHVDSPSVDDMIEFTC